MSNRQNGVPMAQMMNISKGQESIEGIVIVAYKEPRYSSEKQIAKSVTEFGNDLYSACVQKYKTQ